MSIDRLNLLRNIGQFESVDAGARLDFNKLTLVYAENGRGKTTLAAVLRSVGIDDPQLVEERSRLGAEHPPHIVIGATGGQSIVYRDGTWSTSMPDVAVFDDAFVSTNVCSGIEIEAQHRQNLHELILGSEGVDLNKALREQVAEIDRLNQELRQESKTVEPIAVKSNLSVDDFCALPKEPNLDTLLATAERNVAAAKSASSIRQKEAFAVSRLPVFNKGVLGDILSRTLPDLEAEAANGVSAHFRRLSDGGETWVGEGMSKLDAVTADDGSQDCPFCAQPLEGSILIEHYRVYFSDAYERHKEAIQETNRAVEVEHGGEAVSAFERAIRVLAQAREFWKPFVEVPEVDIDTAAVVKDWSAAHNAIMMILAKKAAAPLEPMELATEVIGKINVFQARSTELEQLMTEMEQANKNIAAMKEKAESGDLAMAEADLLRYQAKRDRHSEPMSTDCRKYLETKAAKTDAEKDRNDARKALDHYREAVFPTYQSAINKYLEKFNAGFRLDSVESVNNRGGSSCTYSVLINEISVGLTAKVGPAFRNTLSSGDRNTLALAFFFASLRQDPRLPQKIAVIDDPMTSLDEHRSLATRDEMREVLDQVGQMIVLSHSKPFLCALWDKADKGTTSALVVQRQGRGSTLAEWNVRDDCINEHDRRYEKVDGYLHNGDMAIQREVATALRPIIEVFVRVAYPMHFEPGDVLGKFISICKGRIDNDKAILATHDLAELRSLVDYANTFHHDTNPAWETAAINDGELSRYCERVLSFCKRS